MGTHYVTEHALDRFREHHPQASLEDMWDHLRYGTTVDRRVVQDLLERPYLLREDRYILAPDRRGIFLVGPDSYHGTEYVVRTYLRLSAPNRERALALWPPGV